MSDQDMTKAERKAEKKAQARRRAQIREDKKNLKGDAPYLNSMSRVISRFVWSIIEYVLMFIILSLVMEYMNTGTFDLSKLPDTIGKFLKPGSVLFTALISFLPIMVLENVGIYFGLGSVPRMVFGIAKCLAVLVWVNLVFASAGDIDIIEMSGMKGSSALQGLQGFTVNVTPLLTLMDIILLLCCLIPIGEFLGSRKKHNDAIANHDAHVAKVKANEEEERAQKEAEKQAKLEAKEAKKEAKEAEKLARLEAKEAKKAEVAAEEKVAEEAEPEKVEAEAKVEEPEAEEPQSPKND